jgi:hypothetical protein
LQRPQAVTVLPQVEPPPCESGMTCAVIQIQCEAQARLRGRAGTAVWYPVTSSTSGYSDYTGLDVAVGATSSLFCCGRILCYTCRLKPGQERNKWNTQ